jgi:hypothetical protein
VPVARHTSSAASDRRAALFLNDASRIAPTDLWQHFVGHFGTGAADDSAAWSSAVKNLHRSRIDARNILFCAALLP